MSAGMKLCKNACSTIDLSAQDVEFRILLGFDGFIDKILKPIKTKSENTIVPFQSMQEFSEYISGKSGKSCSIDLESLQEKIGGNMPIAANALGNLGCRTTCVGAMGYPEIHSMFLGMSDRCTLRSVSEPGYCSSLEFGDGKLMMATNTYLDRLDYQTMLSRIEETELVRYFQECDAVAFLNWGELIHSNDIWENILRHILPKCKFSQKKKMLIDFSDFSKRKKDEVLCMRELLKDYAKYFEITVSLNENELLLFLQKLELEAKADEEQQIMALSSWFPCKYFVVHLLDHSKYVEDNRVRTIEKEVIEEPKIITGGGDHFNAGLLFGLLMGCRLEDAIRIGSGLSCLYVREGKNIGFQELIEYTLGHQM